MRIAIIGIALLVTACAPKVYVKSGATQADFAQDQAFCRMYGNAHSYMNPFMAISVTGDCMTAKGWTLQSK